MAARKKPGIAKRLRPQRDAQGRFAAKPCCPAFGNGAGSHNWDCPVPHGPGDFIAGKGLKPRNFADDLISVYTPKVYGVQIGQHAKSKGPNLLKRLRVWLAHKFIDAGLWLWRA